MKPSINIVWLKRDLRTRDHAPLHQAIKDGLPTFIFYCFEPQLIAHSDYSNRHWRFVFESLQDMQRNLGKDKININICHQEVLVILAILADNFSIQNLYSHLETGVKWTFDRDKTVKNWCKANGISYREFSQDGVIRGQKHRDGWQKNVAQLFSSESLETDFSQLKMPEISEELRQNLQGKPIPKVFQTPNKNFQPGGESYAWRYFSSFLEKRSERYSRQLSKPELSRTSCSRMSPYLAFGNISVREVYRATAFRRQETGDNFNLKNFHSRLYWRSHYLQKLESGSYLEFQAINPALNDIDRDQNEAKWNAFKNAKTGYPMVDASIRCLEATGWINFRMRAMLVTFLSYGLWLDWRLIAPFLARLFLDYEPGIHYPQIQMQAGLTGYHTLRIFNPNIQAERHDVEGVFIHKWLPELQKLPAPLCHKPWELTPLDQQFHDFQIGKDYPVPIIDYDAEVRKNKDRYWAFRQCPEVKAALPKVWRQFCILEDIQKYEKELDVCKFEAEK